MLFLSSVDGREFYCSSNGELILVEMRTKKDEYNGYINATTLFGSKVEHLREAMCSTEFKLASEKVSNPVKEFIISSTIHILSGVYIHPTLLGPILTAAKVYSCTPSGVIYIMTNRHLYTQDLYSIDYTEDLNSLLKNVNRLAYEGFKYYTVFTHPTIHAKFIKAAIRASLYNKIREETFYVLDEPTLCRLITGITSFNVPSYLLSLDYNILHDRVSKERKRSGSDKGDTEDDMN